MSLLMNPAAHVSADELAAAELAERGFVDNDLPPGRELTAREIAYHGLPRHDLPVEVSRWRAHNVRNLMRGARRVGLARALHLPHFYGQLFLKVVKANGREIDLGLASLRVVTNNGVNYIVQVFTGVGSLANLKYHGLGTGTVAEAAGDTALGTELTTQYNPDNTRATGTTVVGGSANIYHTVATNTVDAAAAVTEHGILSQAATGGGTLLDRSVFSVVNLANGDSLQSTYDLTFNAGG